VRGETIFVCLEGYSDTVSGDLPGLQGRQVIPVFSSMIATEPLPGSRRGRSIGWEGRECLGDTAHTFIYAQRTADDRIALGGRGAPYAFRSGLPGDGEVPAEVVDLLAGRLSSLFPDLEFDIARAWRGALGVTETGAPGSSSTRQQRIGVARGYAGHGVTATHLAAKTLLDRAAGASTPLDRTAVERPLLRTVGARTDSVVGHPVDVQDLRPRRCLGVSDRGEEDEPARPVRIPVGWVA
jgi:glycine/D-amino acid oxidase-like deaminating enzyme